MNDQEFGDHIAELVQLRSTLTPEDFANRVVALSSELTIARNARNRRRLFDMADEHQRRPMSLDEQDGIFYAHQNGLDCGRRLCLVCNPEETA